MEMAGLSVRGKNHRNNQDSFLTFATDKTMVLAVSDGLGSLSQSGAGSIAVCDILREMAVRDFFLYDDMRETAHRVHAEWLELLKKRSIPVSEAAATCLFCILRNHTAYLFRLGDGFLGIRADGETKVFFDDKTDSFLNETSCLQVGFVPQEWELFCWE